MSDTAVLENPARLRARSPVPARMAPAFTSLRPEPCTDRFVPASQRPPVPAPDREGQFILLILGAAAAAMLLQSSTAISAFVAHWDRFEAFVRQSLP